jgi:hypothetical protein
MPDRIVLAFEETAASKVDSMEFDEIIFCMAVLERRFCMARS